MDLARAPRRRPLTARRKGSGYENVPNPAPISALLPILSCPRIPPATQAKWVRLRRCEVPSSFLRSEVRETPERFDQRAAIFQFLKVNKTANERNF